MTLMPRGSPGRSEAKLTPRTEGARRKPRTSSGPRSTTRWKRRQRKKEPLGWSHHTPFHPRTGRPWISKNFARCAPGGVAGSSFMGMRTPSRRHAVAGERVPRDGVAAGVVLEDAIQGVPRDGVAGDGGAGDAVPHVDAV